MYAMEREETFSVSGQNITRGSFLSDARFGAAHKTEKRGNVWLDGRYFCLLDDVEEVGGKWE